MFLFFKKRDLCPKCGNAVNVRNKESDHAFNCPICRSPIFWDSSHKKLEADTRRSRIAHKEWNAKRRWL